MRLKNPVLSDLREKAKEIRKLIFKTICRAGGGHIPASLSLVEILIVLYHKVLNLDPAKPKNPDRDRCILSKGHAGCAMYCVLMQKGFFSKETLATYGQNGTILGAHPDMHKVPGIEASTGTLGHGLGFGAGIALAGKKDKRRYRVFVILGDGECQEGSVWETALFAGHFKLDNLIAIIDYNKLQAMDRVERIVGLEPLARKWKSFGWSVAEVAGHDIKALLKIFSSVPLSPGKPSMIIAHTVKGKGISFMENVPIWHYRQPNCEESKIACSDLGMDTET